MGLFTPREEAVEPKKGVEPTTLPLKAYKEVYLNL